MARKILKLSLAIAVPAILFLLIRVSYEIYSPLKSSSGKIDFEVQEGKSVSSIAESLEAKGIIKKKRPFLLDYRLFFHATSIKAGEYVLQMPISPKETLTILTEGKVFLSAITIPEGLTILETAEHLETMYAVDRKAFLASSARSDFIKELDEDAQDLEGYLFPETYYFPKGPSAEKIAKSMVSQFKDVFKIEWRWRAAELDKTIREIVILASLIEKETSKPEERPLVSAVFHNRLNIGMKLDCDPTIVYVLKKAGTYKDRLRSKDLKYDSPYNTYLYRELPPGPIANPGRAALEAALYPAAVNFLYFVSKNDGSHHFSRSFREHQNAVNTYQRSRK